MDSSELEVMEEVARLVHESELQFEMMRPFEFNYSNSAGNSSKLICFEPKEEAVFDPVELIEIAPIPPFKSTGGGDNVEAERKRREKLNQGFIHLSSLLPNLKKLDKASVLAEAASYVKQLQSQVSSLEERTSKNEMESIAYVGRHRISSTEDRDTSSSISSNESFGICNSLGGNLLEVEVRISADKDVLIKVHCNRSDQDMVPRVLGEIQKLNLDMSNCNAMDFGKHATVITILAKMKEEFSVTAKSLARTLHQSFPPP